MALFSVFRSIGRKKIIIVHTVDNRFIAFTTDVFTSSLPDIISEQYFFSYDLDINVVEEKNKTVACGSSSLEQSFFLASFLITCSLVN